MDKANIRLECLKLRHRHDRTPAQVIEEAKELENYILETQEEALKKVTTSNPKGPQRLAGKDRTEKN